jgi:hypothetical protein
MRYSPARRGGLFCQAADCQAAAQKTVRSVLHAIGAGPAWARVMTAYLDQAGGQRGQGNAARPFQPGLPVAATAEKMPGC